MYPILLVPAAVNVFVIVAWWRSLASLGFTGEVISRAPNMLPLDCVSAFLSAMVGYLALHAWSDYALTFFGPLPQSGIGNSTLAAGCCLVAMLITCMNCGDRFTTPTVAGLRESAVQTLLTLRIIDRAEEIQKKREL